MANRRILVKRRKAVRNIRKITRTMQLIATARFQASFNRAVATRPYSNKLGELVADLSRAAGDADHPLMSTHEGVGKSALLVLSSSRGLCGGYNASVLRNAVGHIDDQPEGHQVDVHMVGKKGASYFRFLRREMASQILDLSDEVRFDEIEPIANRMMDQFTAGEISSVSVAYMRFESAGRQYPEVLQLLPLQPADAGDEAGSPVEYEFSPEPDLLLDSLLPASVRMRLFQCFMDATVSEHVARMVAMKAATDAAGEMITNLTRQYNRARQTHITMELLDIIGGAAALE